VVFIGRVWLVFDCFILVGVGVVAAVGVINGTVVGVVGVVGVVCVSIGVVVSIVIVDIVDIAAEVDNLIVGS
jgi:hypothetical protein